MDAVSKLAFVEKVWPSSANFFLLRVADGAAVMRAASDQGVLLRSLDRELGDCIRITVGSANENDVLLDTLFALEESPT